MAVSEGVPELKEDARQELLNHKYVARETEVAHINHSCQAFRVRFNHAAASLLTCSKRPPYFGTQK